MGLRVSLAIHLIFSTFSLLWNVNCTTAAGSPERSIVIHCYDCNSGIGGSINILCPGHGTVLEDKDKVATTNCTAGQKCFTMENKKHYNTTIFRGCTKNYPMLPTPLPDDGCYDWKGDTMCICGTDRCNTQAIGNASVAIDAHLTTEITRPPETNRTNGENITCYSCNSGKAGEENPGCTADGWVNPQSAGKVNCTGRCVTKNDRLYPEVDVYRDCSDTWGTLPKPFAPDGCYKWKTDTVCICNNDNCNAAPFGKATEIELDAHITTGVKRPPATNRGNQKNITCYVCNSGQPGKLNQGCTAKGWVNPQSVWKENCTGRCVTKDSFLEPNVEVYRTCSDSFWKFPQPFAPDGCYKYYSEVFCICNYDYCNAAPLGSSTGVWLDAHLKTKETGGASTLWSSLVLLMTLNLMLYFLWINDETL